MTPALQQVGQGMALSEIASDGVRRLAGIPRDIQPRPPPGDLLFAGLQVGRSSPRPPIIQTP
jgi:hypothetical protein